MSFDKHHSEQFKRYLKGIMSPEEAHAFERETLDDPFLQEALEGFELAGHESLKDIEKLKKSINKKEKRRFSWIRLASVAIIILASTWIIYYSQNQPTSSGELSTKEKVSEIQPPFELSDSIMTEQGNIKGEFSKETEPEEETLLIAEAPMTNQNKKEREKQMDMTGESADSKLSGQDFIALNESVQSGNETDDGLSGERLISVAKANPIEIEKSDISIQPEAIAAEKAVAIADEEVVEEQIKEETFYGSNDKSKKSAAGAVARSVLADSGSVDTSKTEEVNVRRIAFRRSAQPKVVMKDYSEYLEANLKYPPYAEENGIEGTVILELTISPSGEISNTIIKKSLGYGCDEEAIRLVREGPVWEPAKKNGNPVEDKVSIKVKFKKQK